MQRTGRLLLSLAILVGVPTLTGCTLRLSFDDPKANAQPTNPPASAQSIERLRGLLQSNDPQVRSIAAAELGAIGPQAHEAAADLDRLLADPDRHVRFAAARALGQIDPGDRATVPTLVLIIDDPQTPPDDRKAAILQLGDMGAAALSARPAIVRLQRSEDLDVRDAAATALGKIDAATAAPVPPATTRPAATPTSAVDLPDAATATAASEESLPKPDLRTDGIQHYSAQQFEALRTWIHRQRDLTADQQQANVQRFEDWNREQEAKIAAAQRGADAVARPSSSAQ